MIELILTILVLMTTKCSRCKVYKNEEDYTYKNKQGFLYTYCDRCRDKLTTYRNNTIKDTIKENRTINTHTIQCECGKKIKLHGNCDYYIKRHTSSKYHILNGLNSLRRSASPRGLNTSPTC
jgi:hypothetical protein